MRKFMMHKTTLLALVDLVLGVLQQLRNSLSTYTNECKYPKAWEQLEKECDAIIAFIALGGRAGRSTTELNDQFSDVMNSDKVRERLNWLIDEKKIMKSVGAKYTNFYFLK